MPAPADWVPSRSRGGEKEEKALGHLDMYYGGDNLTDGVRRYAPADHDGELIRCAESNSKQSLTQPWQEALVDEERAAVDDHVDGEAFEHRAAPGRLTHQVAIGEDRMVGLEQPCRRVAYRHHEKRRYPQQRTAENKHAKLRRGWRYLGGLRCRAEWFARACRMLARGGRRQSSS